LLSSYLVYVIFFFSATFSSFLFYAFFFCCSCVTPDLHSFPTRRSSDLGSFGLGSSSVGAFIEGIGKLRMPLPPQSGSSGGLGLSGAAEPPPLPPSTSTHSVSVKHCHSPQSPLAPT